VKYSNITELWLNGDHEKQRVMRQCGVDEKFITGTASDFEKFRELCRIMPLAVGSPMYVLCQFELDRYFGCRLAINPENCEKIWSLTADRLSQDSFCIADIIKRENISHMFIPCEPTDSLDELKNIAAPRVFPLFNPQKCFDIKGKSFKEHLFRLGEITGIAVTDLDSFTASYLSVLDRFAACGCICAVCQIESGIAFEKPDKYHANEILKRALSGDVATLTNKEVVLWQTQMMRFFGQEYVKRNWAVQLSYGGETRIDDATVLFDYLRSNDALSKTLITHVSVLQIASVASLCERFSPYLTQGIDEAFCPDVIQAEAYLKAYASKNVLGRALPPASLSASPLSLAMHDCLRRTLCKIAGSWVDSGICSQEDAENTIRKVSYFNAIEYFSLDK
jgi:glucuronate isomerase